MADPITAYHRLEQALRALTGTEGFQAAHHLKLERISLLLQLLGAPQRQFAGIHVGGTAGKGSTAVLTAHLLQQAGYKVGLHTSPTLQLVNENIVVNGRLAPSTQLWALFQQLQPAMAQVAQALPFGPPSQFEATVALCFLYFARQQIDVAVVEVGLGGARDATNVLPATTAILTNVSLDHTAILGNSVTAIAQEKVGIIKPGQQLFTAVSQPAVQAIVRQRAHDVGATVSLLSPQDDFQAANLALALAAAGHVSGRSFSPAQQAAARKKGRLPARLELVQERPFVLLDGAHNPAKIAAVAATIAADYQPRRTIVLLALKSDKDVRAILPLLLPLADHLIVSAFRHTGLFAAKAAAEITAVARQLAPTLPVQQQPDARVALQQALALAQPDDLIWITGSLYFAGELRDHWFPRHDLVLAAEAGAFLWP